LKQNTPAAGLYCYCCCLYLSCRFILL